MGFHFIARLLNATMHEDGHMLQARIPVSGLFTLVRRRRVIYTGGRAMLSNVASAHATAVAASHCERNVARKDCFDFSSGLK
jgi:hypothetical protein